MSDTICSRNELVIEGINFNREEGYPYLYHRMTYPKEEVHLELFISDETSLALMEEAHAKKEIKVFNCPNCYLQDSIQVKGKNPPYYTYVSNFQCVENRDYHIVSGIPNTNYDNYKIVATKEHYPLYAIYTELGLLKNLHATLRLQPGNMILHNGSMSTDYHHCHMFIIPDRLDHRTTRGENQFQVIPGVMYDEYSIGSQRYMRLRSRPGDIPALSNVLSKMITYYLHDKMSTDHHLMSAIYINQGGDLTVAISITKYMAHYAYFPNIPMFKTKKYDKSDLDNIEAGVRAIQFPSYHSFVKRFMTTQITPVNDLYNFTKKVFAKGFGAYGSQELEEGYNKIYDLKEIVIKDKFSYRHRMEVFGWYKIIATLLFFLIEKESELFSKIYLDDFSYKHRIIYNRNNISLFGGFPIASSVEEGSRDHMETEIIKIQKKIGAESSVGQVFLTSLTYKYVPDHTSAVLKMMTLHDYADLEYLNGLDINRCREYMPNTMYTYDKFRCNQDIILTSGKEKEDDMVVNLDLKNKKSLCHSSYKPCDRKLSKEGPCSTKISYIFLELINDPTSMADYAETIDHTSCQRWTPFLSCMLQLALVLKIAQKVCGFVHNDLHGENVLLTRNPAKTKGGSFTITEYVLPDGSRYTIPVFDYVPVLIDFGYSRTSKHAGLNKKIFGTSKRAYFQELSNFDDSTDILTHIDAIYIELRRKYKTPSPFLSWFDSLRKMGKKYEGGGHYNKNNKGVIDVIIKQMYDKMYECITPEERRSVSTSYVWGFVEKPGPV